MVYSKTQRMNARDKHEVHMDLRYKAVFWEKGTLFSKHIQETLFKRMEAERDVEMEAVMRGERAREASSTGAAGSGAAAVETKKKTWGLF